MLMHLEKILMNVCFQLFNAFYTKNQTRLTCIFCLTLVYFIGVILHHN